MTSVRFASKNNPLLNLQMEKSTSIESRGDKIIQILDNYFGIELVDKLRAHIQNQNPTLEFSDYIDNLPEPAVLRSSIITPTDQVIAEAYYQLLSQQLGFNNSDF